MPIIFICDNEECFESLLAMVPLSKSPQYIHEEGWLMEKNGDKIKMICPICVKNKNSEVKK